MSHAKQLLLDEISGQIEQHPAFVILSYIGLEANKANEFRRNVAKTGGAVEFVPKRLLIKAAEKSGIQMNLEMLEGHIGLVLTGKDPLETTKAIYEFSKSSNEALKVIGGRIEGTLHDKAAMDMLSKLPGKQEMRAQLLGQFQAPLSQTLSVMNALVSSVVYCLDNKSKQAE